MRTVLLFLGRVAAVVVIVLGGAALAAGVLVPRLTGATPYVVLSGSMAPTLPAGALVVVRPVDPAGIRTGDVITYQVRSGEPVVATHRVVGIGSTAAGERTFRTRGDANGADDVHPVRAVQVQGRLWYFVPYLGRAGTLLTGEQRETLTAVLAVGLIGYAGWQVRAAVQERRAVTQTAGTGPTARRSSSARGSSGGSRATGLVLAVVLSGSVWTPGAPARAEAGAPDRPPSVGLSLDGRTWNQDSVSPLFDRGMRWVPGDVASATFYVRNDSRAPVAGQAEVLMGPGSEVLTRELSFRTRLAGAAWRHGVRSAPVVLAPGDVVPVDVEVAFASGAMNETQRSRVALEIRVALTDVAVPPGQEPGAPVAPEQEPLAPTGANPLVLLLLAVAAVLAGTALWRRHG
ncbi:signal peptidase I [Promicromonospora thailandica]|uniref:Signal peptidase I n=1 Tax=Promicromonospora thailandica TaxID=765201 RepID=A0A9X2G4Z4_9MICO|nr:signal peptidase I [Promicromonospora thailandica]MCP2265808.1 signal peptidase I [Promicromonospora thailandica]BFF21836.1 hypothetical protein GCM10025730_53570 [Promicromonospora thailandica]